MKTFILKYKLINMLMCSLTRHIPIFHKYKPIAVKQVQYIFKIAKYHKQKPSVSMGGSKPRAEMEELACC